MTGRRSNNIAGVRSAALAALPNLLSRWLPGGEQRGTVYVALNPRRDDRNLGSFQIDTLTERWRDHAIGVGGKDVASLYAYLFTGGDYRAAFRALANDPLVTAALASGVTAPPAKPAAPLRHQGTKLAAVHRIYRDAVGLSGMPAAAYLHGRGLRPNDGWDSLRASVQHYPGVGACPALLAPIEALDGSMVGLHRTYLTPLGEKLDVPNPRRTLGQVKGAAVRLGGPPTNELIVCEGLEDGLTIYQEMDGAIPVWVAGGATFLHQMHIPHEVQVLTIARDNDAVGQLAALRAADVFGVGGREVRIMKPDDGFKDFNDQLRGIRS